MILGLLVANRSLQPTLEYQRKAAELQEENDKARYTALQNQLNQHFLFNSITTLIAEIEYNPQNAVSFTKNLSKVYRYVLQAQNKPLVTLHEELRFLSAYLFLHEVRLGNCIDKHIDIDEEYMEAQLLPLPLQLLVVNLINNNVVNTLTPMTSRISID